MQFTEKDLTKLIQDVEVAFADHLNKAESEAAQTAPLAKAEDEKPADKKEDKPSEDKADKPEAKEESKESNEAPKADAEAKPEGEAAAPAEAAPEAAAQAPAAEAAANAVYDAEDMAHLEKMYMSMSADEQLIHHDVLRKCMDASQAAAPAAEAAPAAPAAELDKCGDMSMQKSENTSATEAAPAVEVKAEDVKSNPEVELAKSEAAAATAKANELQKSLDTVQEFLTKLVKKVPQGKAITSYEQVAKSETDSKEGQELSKSEINAILGKKAADPSLTKSDRDAINAFYLNGANINTISHLLK